MPYKYNTNTNSRQYEHKTIQYNTIQYNTIQDNTIQYNTMQYNIASQPSKYSTNNTIQYRSVQYIAGPKVFCFSIEGLSVAWEPFLKVFHRKSTKLRVLGAGTVRIFKRS